MILKEDLENIVIKLNLIGWINKIIPMGIVYIEKCDSYKHAIKREKDIKRLTLTKKLKLIEDYKLL